MCRCPSCEVVVRIRCPRLLRLVGLCSTAFFLLLPPLLADGPPEAAKKHYEAGMSRKRAQDYAAAIAEFRKAVEADLGYSDAWSCVAAERQADAIEAFGRVVELAPGTERAREAEDALRRLGGAQQSGPEAAPAPEAEPDGPAVFVKEGGELFHCDHGCPSIHTRVMGVPRKPYPNPLAAAREGFRACPQCRPVPGSMAPAVQGILAEYEQLSRKPKPITCDRFDLKVEWEVPGEVLLVSLNTDLPLDADILVTVVRRYEYEGEHEPYAKNYVDRAASVSQWQKAQRVRLDDGAWDRQVQSQIDINTSINAELARTGPVVGMTSPKLPTRIRHVEPDITVRAVFHLRQKAPRFACGNRNVTGEAMRPVITDLELRESLLREGVSASDAARIMRLVAEDRRRRGEDHVAIGEVTLPCPYDGLWKWCAE